MGLFEIFGESYNPGNIGGIEKNKAIKKAQNIRLLVLKSIISMGIIVGVSFLIFRDGIDIAGIFVYIGVMFIYCILGYLIIPKPDYENIGWLGGMMDHPFRFSDDLNRMLIFLSIVLYPGRFIATTVINWIWLLKKSNSEG